MIVLKSGSQFSYKGRRATRHGKVSDFLPYLPLEPPEAYIRMWFALRRFATARQLHRNRFLKYGKWRSRICQLPAYSIQHVHF